MTAIETRISIGLSRAIDQIIPELFDRITAVPPLADIKSARKRVSAFSAKRVRAALKPAFLIALEVILLIRYWGYIVGYPVPNGRIYINEHFFEGRPVIISMCAIHGGKSLVPGDVSREFGFDPLENLRVPQGMKSCYGNGSGYNEATYFDESMQMLYRMEIDYRENPGDLNSKEIQITLTHEHPLTYGAEPFGFTRVSKINNTEATVSHIDQNNEYYAKFSYQNVGYCINAYNGVTKEEFMRVITSIVCSQ